MKQAAESVLISKIEDLEFILADEGSKYSSLRIFREYEKANPGVMVIHQVSSGVSMCDAATVYEDKTIHVGYGKST